MGRILAHLSCDIIISGVVEVVSKEDKESISGMCSALFRSLGGPDVNFNKLIDLVNDMEQLFDKIKGIRENIKNLLKTELLNIRDALYKKDMDKSLAALDELTILLQTNLRIKFDPGLIKARSLENLRRRGRQ